jgi:hypothetical protein
MRALTMDELSFVSGGEVDELGWNPFSNPTKPSSWNPEEKSPEQRAFEDLVRWNARMAVADEMRADAAGMVSGAAAGTIASAAAGRVTKNGAVTIGAGELTGAGVDGFVSWATKTFAIKSREFYLNMYYSILARYGM